MSAVPNRLVREHDKALSFYLENLVSFETACRDVVGGQLAIGGLVLTQGDELVMDIVVHRRFLTRMRWDWLMLHVTLIGIRKYSRCPEAIQ